jgi:hypothetical protein
VRVDCKVTIEDCNGSGFNRDNESVVGHSASIELSLGSMESTVVRPELLACNNTSEDSWSKENQRLTAGSY